MGLQNQRTTDAFVPRVSELLPHELGCMQTHIRRMIYPPEVIVNLISGPSDYGKHVCARRRSWTSSVLSSMQEVFVAADYVAFMKPQRRPSRTISRDCCRTADVLTFLYASEISYCLNRSLPRSRPLHLSNRLLSPEARGRLPLTASSRAQDAATDLHLITRIRLAPCRPSKSDSGRSNPIQIHSAFEGRSAKTIQRNACARRMHYTV